MKKILVTVIDDTAGSEDREVTTGEVVDGSYLQVVLAIARNDVKEYDVADDSARFTLMDGRQILVDLVPLH